MPDNLSNSEERLRESVRLYTQPWADSAQGEFSAHLQLLGFVFTGGLIFVATIGKEYVFDIVNRYLLIFIFGLLLFNSILIIHAIQNHRTTLYYLISGKSDQIRSNRDNNFRIAIVRISEVIFTLIIVLFANILFCNLKSGF